MNELAFSPASRVWIYQADRSFSKDELEELDQVLSQFTKQWTAHDRQLHAGHEIRYGRFIILKVDETAANNASGCSIDKSVRLMQELEAKSKVKLFDRWNIAYKKGEDILAVEREEFELLLANGHIQDHTIVFNNIVATLHDLHQNWEIPFKDSWHAQVFRIDT